MPYQARQQMQISCQLDPRFHKLPFLKAAARAEAKKCTLQFAKSLTMNEITSVNQVNDVIVVEENTYTEDIRPGTSADLLSVMYGPEIMQAQQQHLLSKRKKETLEDEFAAYMKEAPLPLDHCPLEWWKLKQTVYPQLAAAAKMVLGIPATSISSERIFSKAGLVLTARRNRLSGDTVNKLVFLAYNKNI